MRMRRFKVSGSDCVYHCMTRTVNGELCFGDREKEVLRKMLWQVADFCGVEILTYCLMSNHFHVLVRVPAEDCPSDSELLRRFRVLYPKPTRFEQASVSVLRTELEQGGEDAAAVRRRLSLRMGDVSEFMKTLKQRFSVWYNRSHQRYGTLWAERFKSVLVEGQGNALQTMAAYIDLNPVRAGLVEDPKDYRFCGYAEAIAGSTQCRRGLMRIWSSFGVKSHDDALVAHRMLLFGKGSDPMTQKGAVMDHARALKVLSGDGTLPKAVALRCRIRYFTDGAILGSASFLQDYATAWQLERQRKHPPKVHTLKGSNWGDLAVMQGLRKNIFG